MKYKRYKKGNYRMFLAGGVDESQANAISMYNNGRLGSGNRPGSTSTIVEEESNPELQEARVNALTEQQRLLMQQQQEVSQTANLQEAQDEVTNEQQLNEFNAKEQQKQQKQDLIANTTLKQGAKFLNPEAFAAHEASGSAEVGKLGKGVIQGFRNMKAVPETTQLLSGQMMETGANVAGTGFKAGLSQVGTAAGNFAKSPAGLGIIANLAGEGIHRLSDDNDATTLNFGEGTGKVLKGVGTGLSTGAMIGAAVGGPLAPLTGAAGAVIGGGIALGRGLIGRNKARKEETRLENESTVARNEGVNTFNEDLTSKYSTAMSGIAAGAVNQKAISGQDLGYNLTARNGGMRYGNGGISAGVQMPMNQQGMMHPQGIMPTQVMPQPQQPMYRGGGMRMGMPRYGY